MLPWQLARSVANRRRLRWHVANVLAAALVLAWLAVLGVNRLLPVAKSRATQISTSPHR